MRPAAAATRAPANGPRPWSSRGELLGFQEFVETETTKKAPVFREHTVDQMRLLV